MIVTSLASSGDTNGRASLSSDRRTALLIFSGLFVFYLAVLRGSVEIYDMQAMLAVTKNLVDHGSLATEGAGYPVEVPWSPYGLAVSILAVPAYVLSKWTGRFDLLVSVISPFLTAAAS